MLLCGFVAILVAVLASWTLPQRVGRAVAMLAIPAGIVAWLRVQRPPDIRAERLVKGQCPYCGSDLTGNVSGVCPRQE